MKITCLPSLVGEGDDWPLATYYPCVLVPELLAEFLQLFLLLGLHPARSRHNETALLAMLATRLAGGGVALSVNVHQVVAGDYSL
jgi:hypothetical protein